MPCNSEQYREQKTLYLCGICKLVQPSATTDRTLVMSRGKRFESARRLSRFGVDTPDTRKERSRCDLPVASLHHLYITEAWARSIQKLIARNGRRNALKTVVM